MLIDLSRWSPGAITAAATCLAATVAAVTGFVVAAINSWSGRKLAREASQREFRLATIRPYLEFLDRRIAMYSELLETGSVLTASLAKAKSLPSSEHNKAVQELDSLVLGLEELQSKIGEGKTIYRNAGIYALLLSDQYLVDSFFRFLQTETALLNQIVNLGAFPTTPESLKTFRKHEQEALKAAVKLRIAFESFIFRTRGLIRRGAYFLWSKIRSTWKKISR